MSNTDVKPNIQRLKNLYKANENYRLAFDHFASRQNNSRRTTVDRLQQILNAEGHDVPRGDIIELFKALAGSDCGAFVIGRKGHPSRFEWTVSLVAVGQAATGEEVEVSDLSQSELEESTSDEEATQSFIDHRFVLRPAFEVSIRLPQDFSDAEATRLSEFVRALPFGRLTAI